MQVCVVYSVIGYVFCVYEHVCAMYLHYVYDMYV